MNTAQLTEGRGYILKEGHRQLQAEKEDAYRRYGNTAPRAYV